MKMNKLILGVLFVSLCSCQSTPQTRPNINIPSTDPWTPLVHFYATHDTGCPDNETVATALKGCVDIDENSKVCQVDLKECHDLYFLDKSALLTDVDTLTSRVAALSSQRWYWGLAGIGVGALVLGLTLGLTK